jgi:SAM-dependent methyltransferase
MAFKVSSEEETRTFYDRLIKGEESRGFWGKSNRFNGLAIPKKKMIRSHFLDVILPHISSTDKLLDLGTGTGGFLACLSPYCEEIVGTDISDELVMEATRVIELLGLTNAIARRTEGTALPFDDDEFDAILLMDVIHHMEDAEKTIAEAMRVLKPGGKVIVFEPNLLNPMLALFSLIDPNERGLLALGTQIRYRKLLSPFMVIESIGYNGLLVGPDNFIFRSIVRCINLAGIRKIFGWVNPHIFAVGNKT